MAQGLITFGPTFPNQLSSCNKWAQTDKHICQTKKKMPDITLVQLSPTVLSLCLIRIPQTISSSSSMMNNQQQHSSFKSLSLFDTTYIQQSHCSTTIKMINPIIQHTYMSSSSLSR
ncbi:hypothetical protein HanRHA438_Chr11g0522821 [Helianthus annuus]|uniref:Uncharacterized protein n=1 Tax=Helianthus annuus TaxID=4232 RepID=A0A251RZE3_HELAN|nr:hypothetical protein HanXRQr2_Chr11g0510621 [Helianthus annuus]KAJ0511181.1 hypothetical protein HanIR_Chr11g0549101 [Helianthus annuus]KAJ0872360.1 hypothetical protein HanRHA438_Chr11g0522821 [Helianthus annuus]KAJ0876735.1 hypothetical protein HanPSC8_Chr11g0491861 [Helianthus annuus]